MKKCPWIFALILLISGGAFADQTFYAGASAPEGDTGGWDGRIGCDITCPTGGIPEYEAVCYDNYRDSVNTGCNCHEWDPPTICEFSPIDCGDTVCGTSGNFVVYNAAGVPIREFRDTDWYRIVLTTPTIITWSAYAEFPVLLLILRPTNTACLDNGWRYSVTGDACQLTTVTSACLPAGVYYLWIGPQVFRGLPCGLDYYAWVDCQPCTDCDPTEIVRFFPGETSDCQCVDLCPGAVTTVAICGSPAFPPVVHVLPGCNYTFPGCLEECPPAQFTYNPQGWVFDPTVSCWVNQIIGLTNGCVCVCFDRWLPVELSSFDAVAGNGSVTLHWSTASESNSDRFEILRNGTIITRVSAAGSSTTTHNYSYTDRSVDNGVTYTYALRSVDLNGVTEEHGTVSATPRGQSAEVAEFALHQNYPNPFNPVTSISFDLVDGGQVTLKVFNPMGQEVATVVSGAMTSGRHTVTFDASNLPSGMYLYRLETTGYSAAKKMLLMK